MLFGDRNKMINHIISECSKEAQKSIREDANEWGS